MPNGHLVSAIFLQLVQYEFVVSAILQSLVNKPHVLITCSGKEVCAY